MAENSQNLNAHYDPDSDALYLGLKKGSEESFLEIAPGLNLEVNEHGQIIGIEVLNASHILEQISPTPGAKQVSRA